MTDSLMPAKSAPEAVTVYLWPAQQFILEELKLKLRRHGLKTSKSQLVRVALKLLDAQTIDQLITYLEPNFAK